jgi:glutamate/tyrosine decarboxylase-like PLP-dependent enzyme
MNKPLLDFAIIIGSSTQSARNLGAEWDNVNLADATNKSAQEYACFFINYHAELMGFPDFSGLLEHSASDANLRALEIARNKTKKRKVLCTNLSHVSIAQACHTLGLEPLVLDAVPSLGYQVDPEQLANCLDVNRKEVAAVVSTHGTTQLGNLENLASNPLVQEMRKEGIWLHVDAAYGGVISRLSRFVPRDPLFAISTDREERIITIPEADSITLDPYKFTGKPGVALLLTKPENIPKLAVPYYEHSPYTLHTTLSAGPIVTWCQVLRECSPAGLSGIADDCIALAKVTGADLLRGKVPLLVFPKLGIVPFSLPSQERRDQMYTDLLEQGFKLGKVQIIGKEYQTYGLRIVVTPRVNPELQMSALSDLCKKISQLYHK